MLFFLEDIVGELLGREVLEVVGGIGVFAVEVDSCQRPIGIVFQQILSGNFPGAFVFLALAPPFEATGEFFELDRLGFGVVLSPFG